MPAIQRVYALELFPNLKRADLGGNSGDKVEAKTKTLTTISVFV
jgi:hypothetical protein